MAARPDTNALAEKAKAAKDCPWWLWDDEPSHEYGPALAFAHLATPRVILALLADHKRLEDAGNLFLREIDKAELDAPEAWFGRALDEARDRFRAALGVSGKENP